MRINVTLSAYEGDAFPDADTLYEAFVRERLAELYPTATVNVSTAQGRTKVYAYPTAGKPWDDEISQDLTTECAVTWWEEFCAQSKPLALPLHLHSKDDACVEADCEWAGTEHEHKVDE